MEDSAAVGQLPTFGFPTDLSFKGLVDSETCRTVNSL